MAAKVLGISGSPVKNSNTDRLVKRILDATGLETEFVKLSSINVRPCRACKLCVEDNICKVKDDFQALAEKVKAAKALAVGGYSPYRALDGFTKAFLERLWSLRHVTNLVRGKLAVTVVTGLRPSVTEKVTEMISGEMVVDGMEVIGQLEILGSAPCLTCGRGDDCEVSGVKGNHGEDAYASAEFCRQVEDQKEVWEKAWRVGKTIGERLG